MMESHTNANNNTPLKRRMLPGVRVAAQLLLVCTLTGCIHAPSAALPPAAIIAPYPMPGAVTQNAPVSPTAESMEDRLVEAFFDMLELPFAEAETSLVPQLDENLGVHPAVQNIALFRQTAKNTNAALQSTLDRLGPWYNAQFSAGSGSVIATSVKGEMDWKGTLAFLRTGLLTGQSPTTLFKKALEVSATVSRDPATSIMQAKVEVRVPGFNELWQKASRHSRDLVTGKLAYAYLLTVYDDNGKMQKYREPKDVAAHLKTIVSPLKGGKIRKTWFAGRDNGTRKHTGTDILAPEDTPIISCTDGTVTAIDYGSNGAGNYVIVTDSAGYEFHYYHMVRLTTFRRVGERITAGTLIGHVGNTGNSSANHLHVTILHPNGQYLNPYPYLVAAAKR